MTVASDLDALAAAFGADAAFDAEGHGLLDHAGERFGSAPASTTEGGRATGNRPILMYR